MRIDLLKSDGSPVAVRPRNDLPGELWEMAAETAKLYGMPRRWVSDERLGELSSSCRLLHPCPAPGTVWRHGDCVVTVCGLSDGGRIAERHSAHALNIVFCPTPEQFRDAVRSGHYVYLGHVPSALEG